MQKVFWLCRARTGAKIDESMQAGDIGHERIRTDVRNGFQVLEEDMVLVKNARGWTI